MNYDTFTARLHTMIGRYTKKDYLIGFGILVLIFLIVLGTWYASRRVSVNPDGHYEERVFSPAAVEEINTQTQEFGVALEEEKPVLEEKKKMADTRESKTPTALIDPRVNTNPTVKEQLETMSQNLFIPPDAFELPPR